MMQTTTGMPASMDSTMASAANGRRDEYEGHVRAGLIYCIRDRAIDWHRVLEEAAALSGGDAGDKVGTVLPAAAGMEAALPAGYPLHQESSVRVGENTQEALPFVWVVWPVQDTFGLSLPVLSRVEGSKASAQPVNEPPQ